MFFGRAFALALDREPTVWDEIWDALLHNETQYENLGNGMFSLSSLRMIILGIFVGLALASFAAVFNKRVWGDFVRKLLYEECLSPESAKTLYDLGYGRNTTIRYGVRRGVNLRRVVRCREEEEYLRELEQKQAEYEEKRREDPSLPKFRAEPFCVSADEHHFYIPEEMKYMADVKFEKQGTTWLGAIVFVFILAVGAVILFLTLPYILNLLNDWFGAVRSIFSYQDNMIT